MNKIIHLSIIICVLASNAFAQCRASELVGLGIESSVAKALGCDSPLVRTLTVTDNDAQNNTLTAAEIVGGITVHTSVTGAGTVTTDTATNIIAGSSSVGKLTTNNSCIMHWYINDGDQTLTFAGGTDVTIADTGQTIANNESALLLFCRKTATTVTMYHVGS